MIRQTSLPELAAWAAVLTGGSATIKQGNRPPFRRAAQLGEISVGRRPGEIAAPRGHVVVPGRRAIVAPLGDRLQRVNLAGSLTQQGKNQSDQAKDVKHHRKSLACLNQGATDSQSFPRLHRLRPYQAIRPRPPNRGPTCPLGSGHDGTMAAERSFGREAASSSSDNLRAPEVDTFTDRPFDALRRAAHLLDLLEHV